MLKNITIGILIVIILAQGFAGYCKFSVLMERIMVNEILITAAIDQTVIIEAMITGQQIEIEEHTELLLLNAESLRDNSLKLTDLEQKEIALAKSLVTVMSFIKAVH